MSTTTAADTATTTNTTTTTTTTGGGTKEATATITTSQQRRYLIQVSERLPTLQDCHDFCADPSCGAVATFVGITRDNFNGNKVLKLSYEGYVPMALKELQKLCNDATTQYPGICKIAAVHILGDCPVGQASVILAASSPHRNEALHCVEYLINELKARIPIWKREVYNDGDNGEGGSVWKENIEWKEGRLQRVMKREEKEGQV
jgi:molybdopterin synthase catalytic subunit